MERSRLLEPEIKAKVISHLIKQGSVDDGTLLLNEYSIDRHARRVDLLAISQNTSIAFEIKSEADRLNRIEGQIEKYLNFFDKLVIVAAPKHINGIVKVSPRNVAIWKIDSEGISIIQTGQLKRINDKHNLQTLMSAKDLNVLANQVSKSTGYKSRILSKSILENVSLETLREACFSSITSKYTKPNLSFWKKVKESQSVSREDIALLSLYQAQRHALKLKNASKLQVLEKLLKNSITVSSLHETSKNRVLPVLGQVPIDIKSLSLI